MELRLEPLSFCLSTHICLFILSSLLWLVCTWGSLPLDLIRWCRMMCGYFIYPVGVIQASHQQLPGQRTEKDKNPEEHSCTLALNKQKCDAKFIKVSTYFFPFFIIPSHWRQINFDRELFNLDVALFFHCFPQCRSLSGTEIKKWVEC